MISTGRSDSHAACLYCDDQNQ